MSKNRKRDSREHCVAHTKKLECTCTVGKSVKGPHEQYCFQAEITMHMNNIAHEEKVRRHPHCSVDRKRNTDALIVDTSINKDSHEQ